MISFSIVLAGMVTSSAVCAAASQVALTLPVRAFCGASVGLEGVGAAGVATVGALVAAGLAGATEALALLQAASVTMPTVINKSTALVIIFRDID